MLRIGVIVPSMSLYCSPLLLVKKPDGNNRPVVDFRQLNRATVFDAEPMTNPEMIFEVCRKTNISANSIATKVSDRMLTEGKLK